MYQQTQYITITIALKYLTEINVDLLKIYLYPLKELRVELLKDDLCLRNGLSISIDPIFHTVESNK